MNNRSIALICDDKYVMPTAVTIQSIKDTYKGVSHVDVYVCTFGLNDSNCIFLESLSTDCFSVIIKICEADKYKNYIERINQKTHVTPTSLLKFELPNILPDVDKLLYLDSDIIVKGDLEELFQIDIKDYYLAASPEIWRNLDKYWAGEDFSIENSFYFNSGVLLYNLNLMRIDNISSSLWNRKIENSKDPSKKTMDQDTLNDVCSIKTLRIPIVWNYNTAFSSKKVIDLNVLNQILKTSYRDNNQLLEDARILHYVGKEDKPWNYSSANCIDYWNKAYINAGYNIESLKRESIKHGFLWYFNILREQYKKNGIKYTIRYLLYKLKARK